MTKAHFCPACMNRVSAKQKLCGRCRSGPPRAGWPLDPFIGRVVDGKYTLSQRLGAGGFGLVFLARQQQSGIDLGDVVLKYLHGHTALNDKFRVRFINEARAARRVASPHVVKVFDLGFDEDGVPFIVMEYLQGRTLEQLLREKGKLSPHRTFRVGLQVASALHECHSVDVVHRDLKPDNLLVLDGRTQDFVKIFDFGIARVPAFHQTQTSSSFGTPLYMAPEQILHGEIDEGVDIFALGVVLYQCLTGRPPILVGSSMEYLQANLNVPATPLREVLPDMPESLESLLSEMLDKRRKDRPPSMEDVEERLRCIGVQKGWVPAETGEINLTDVARRQAARDEQEHEDLTLEPPAEPQQIPGVRDAGTGTNQLLRAVADLPTQVPEDKVDAFSGTQALDRKRQDELASEQGSEVSDRLPAGMTNPPPAESLNYYPPGYVPTTTFTGESKNVVPENTLFVKKWKAPLLAMFALGMGALAILFAQRLDQSDGYFQDDPRSNTTQKSTAARSPKANGTAPVEKTLATSNPENDAGPLDGEPTSDDQGAADIDGGGDMAGDILVAPMVNTSSSSKKPALKRKVPRRRTRRDGRSRRGLVFKKPVPSKQKQKRSPAGSEPSPTYTKKKSPSDPRKQVEGGL